MLPIVVRSTEETLKLLPPSLKEAALALGMPFHRVIFKVVIPVGISGYQEIRERLSQWMPIAQAPEFWFQAPGSALIGALCLLPAILLMRSACWFLWLRGG